MYEQPNSPCLLSNIEPSSILKDTSNPAEEDSPDENIERVHLDVSTKRWIKKYNNLLDKCDRFERRVIYYCKQTWHYKNKLRDISDLCGVSPPNSPRHDL